MKSRPSLLTDSLLFMLALEFASSPVFSQSRDQPEKDFTGLHPLTSLHPEEEVAGKEPTLEGCCEKLLSARRSIYYLNARSYRMALQLRAVYTRNETLFFCLGLGNHSHLDYTVDSIRFYIVDERRAAKTQAKWIPLSPLYACDTRIVRGKSHACSVIAFPKFTLDAGKLLVIDVLERNGGRHLQLHMDNFTLVRARPL
jgi:hypothetical protein